MKIKELFGFFNSFKGFLIIGLTGVLVGSACALFLTTLEWVTIYREHHTYIIFGLPIAGLIIGLVYHYYGKEISAGNNLILEQYNQPTQKLPIKMGVLIYFSTLLTHLVGGSAGREGTAIQIGTSIADQFSDVFKISKSDRKIILLLGISSGFAAVFGTPLAGAVFALELLYFSKFSIKSILPVVFVAYIADFTVKFWNVQHTIYHVKSLPKWEFQTILWLILIGIIFGLASFLFVKSSHFVAAFFTKTISFPPFRPFFGGVMLLIIFYFIDLNNYQGLGIPIILNSFEMSSNWYVFLIKIALTALTLGAGFKGGEVTPLFFIGATLGSALC